MLKSSGHKDEITCYLFTALILGLVFGCVVTLVFFTGTAIDELNKQEVNSAQKMLGVYWTLMMCISSFLGFLTLSSLYIAIVKIIGQCIVINDDSFDSN